MRKLVFVHSVSDVQPMVTKLTEEYTSGLLQIGSVTGPEGIREGIARLESNKLDVLVMPGYFATTGWVVRGKDIEVVFDEGFPNGPLKMQCLSRVHRF